MTLAVHIQKVENRVKAMLLGAPEIQATEATQEAAIKALQEKIDAGMSQGELLFMEVEASGLTALAGRYQDDASLDEITADIYRSRDDQG